MNIYLLAGQSNMAGRGKVTEPQKISKRIFSLNKNSEWVPAKDPLHWDKQVAGVGPGLSFAHEILKTMEDNETIGLVPCACGGSPISAWQDGVFWHQTNSHPLDDTFERMKTALASGTLKGILWHQGEGDSNEERAPLYQQKLEELIHRFRKEFNAPNVPFIIGQLGQFEDEPLTEWHRLHKQIVDKIPFCAYVSSYGLTSIGDNLHFNTESQVEFGKRYAKAFTALNSIRIG